MTESSNPVQMIQEGKTALGIELGSTRIKAVLIGDDTSVLATGGHGWENRFEDGLWTYPVEAVWAGLKGAYSSLQEDVRDKYGVELEKLGSLGISGMMHGYMALDADGNLLVPFRTWRNTNTDEATKVLSEALDFNMPHRWSSAHLFQAVLDKEPHLENLAEITTLAGLVHQRLSGRAVVGVGDASGMFPIDPKTGTYDQARIDIYDRLLAEHGVKLKALDVLPKVELAGADAGHLTEEGARLLDPSGTLQAGVLMCPPEGDAGTGMVATNAVAERTGNVSAGTSIFAMVVLENDLKKVHPELDMVTTPDGKAVAMVHSNNGTSEWDAWVEIFHDLVKKAGHTTPKWEIYDLAYAQALEGAADGAGLVAYNFLSGEPIVAVDGGRPLFFRTPDSDLNLANFMRTQLMSIFAVLRLGMDILTGDEGVKVDHLFAHGGLFKTPVVAQRIMAAALKTPVQVSATAGEGGPWGMALLALYASEYTDKMSLPQFLDDVVFTNLETTTESPDPADVEGFNTYVERYKRGLPAEQAAVDNS